MNIWNNIPCIRTADKLTHLPVENGHLVGMVPFRALTSNSEPISRIDFIFDAGSRYQQKTFQSNLTNQMLLEGTDRLSGSEIAEMADYYGSYLTPGSDRDEAEFSMACIDKHLEPTLDLSLQLLTGATFPEAEFNILKNKRIHQIKIDNQRVETIAHKAYVRELYGAEHPYGKIGETRDLKNLDTHALKDFFHSGYNFANARILIVSNQPQRILKLLENQLGAIILQNAGAAGFEKKPLPKANEVEKRIQRLHKKNAVQAAIRMGRLMFPRNHPDFHLASILVTLLGGYFGSRLMKKIREEKGYTYGIGAYMSTLKDHGSLTISTTVGTDVLEDAISDCRNELTKLCNDRIPAEELDLVRKYISGDIQRKLDGAPAQADILRSFWLHNLDFTEIEHFMNVLHEISPDELRDAAIKYLQPESFIEVVCT